MIHYEVATVAILLASYNSSSALAEVEPPAGLTPSIALVLAVDESTSQLTLGYDATLGNGRTSTKISNNSTQPRTRTIPLEGLVVASADRSLHDVASLTPGSAVVLMQAGVRLDPRFLAMLCDETQILVLLKGSELCRFNISDAGTWRVPGAVGPPPRLSIVSERNDGKGNITVYYSVMQCAAVQFLSGDPTKRVVMQPEMVARNIEVPFPPETVVETIAGDPLKHSVITPGASILVMPEDQPLDARFRKLFRKDTVILWASATVSHGTRQLQPVAQPGLQPQR